MSVVLRSASGPLNDITLKKQLSVDRSSCIKSKTSNPSVPAAARSKTSSLPLALSTQETSPLAESKPCSKRKPLKDITLKVCHKLPLSVASCHTSPAEPDVDFTIYVDVPPTQQQPQPKTDKSTQVQIVQVVTPKSDKTVDEGTLGKENIAPTTISVAQKKNDNLLMTVDKSLKTTKKQPTKKQPSSQSNKSSSDATALKRKRRTTLTMEVSTSTKRASLRMMR
ncbi:hypothetical protein K450DRAFT_220400 [Umbelopsis ramanniana AG]|uniref:Uncharacterized protein n=1 Tax=Umbelopsis ramanniana AG TaxID=1314678 RepID=A0AAD5EIV7_UMBRA|nr:uncharacterized protein K450DRAFT_220400 [Umbelopsis ramanniana AG]KAI8583880.1 hypothetical protein K450DRAFT_220400 [Umbelopsis ramanniana AG]